MGPVRCINLPQSSLCISNLPLFLEVFENVNIFCLSPFLLIYIELTNASFQTLLPLTYITNLNSTEGTLSSFHVISCIFVAVNMRFLKGKVLFWAFSDMKQCFKVIPEPFCTAHSVSP